MTFLQKAITDISVEKKAKVGTMNLFVSWVNEKGEKELITAPLGELVLPGVTSWQQGCVT